MTRVGAGQGAILAEVDRVRRGSNPALGGSVYRPEPVQGATNHYAGRSAEDIVSEGYRRGGHHLLERRWRGAGGEIDLIFRKDDAIVFVEVKKSKSHRAAAARLTRRQMERIYSAAGGYLATCPAGQDTEARFDVALVDARGRTEIIENAFGH